MDVESAIMVASLVGATAFFGGGLLSGRTWFRAKGEAEELTSGSGVAEQAALVEAAQGQLQEARGAQQAEQTARQQAEQVAREAQAARQQAEQAAGEAQTARQRADASVAQLNVELERRTAELASRAEAVQSLREQASAGDTSRLRSLKQEVVDLKGQLTSGQRQAEQAKQRLSAAEERENKSRQELVTAKKAITKAAAAAAGSSASVAITQRATAAEKRTAEVEKRLAVSQKKAADALKRVATAEKAQKAAESTAATAADSQKRAESAAARAEQAKKRVETASAAPPQSEAAGQAGEPDVEHLREQIFGLQQQLDGQQVKVEQVGDMEGAVRKHRDVLVKYKMANERVTELEHYAEENAALRSFASRFKVAEARAKVLEDHNDELIGELKQLQSRGTKVTTSQFEPAKLMQEVSGGTLVVDVREEFSFEANIDAYLRSLANHNECEAAVIADEQGLALAGVGGDNVQLSMAALCGTIFAMVEQAQIHLPIAEPKVIELVDSGERVLRFRAFDWEDNKLMLSTLYRRTAAELPHEGTVLTAFSQLFAASAANG